MERRMNYTLQFETRNGDTVLFNPTAHHRNLDGDARIGAECREALQSLKRLNVRRPLESWALEAADAVIDGDILVSPEYLFYSSDVLHKDLARYFVSRDGFASELWDRLQEVGAFKFLDTVSSREASEAVLLRIVSVFGMSALGHEAVDNVNVDFIHAVVDWFRTPDNSRWRDFGRSEIIYQGLRAVVLGLREIYDDPSLETKAGNNRAYGGRLSTWKTFAQSREPMNVELNELLEDFLENSLTSPKNGKTAMMYVGEWLQTKHPGKTFSDVCRMPVQARGFPEYLEFEGKKTGKVLLDLGNVTKRLTDHFISVLESRNPGVVYYPFVAESELIRVRNAPVKAKPNSTRSRPFPEKLVPMAKFILDEAGGWGKRSGLFDVRLASGETVYCPVIPTLLRNAFDIPLRIVQWRRLDSGEGDVRRFDADRMAWEDNTGPMAGYWADREGAPRDGFPERGYAHEFVDGPKKITGFFINTNKTSEPYAIPWQHEGVHQRLWKLRQWQEKNNPIKDALRPDEYVDDRTTLSKKTLQRLPDIIPLHRLFPTSARPLPGRIPTTSEMDHAWQEFCAEFQRLWNIENPENPIELVSFDPRTKQPCKAKYNLHGLRVRGLTDLYRSGMKPEMISRVIAGHATVRMTLYYLEFLPEEVDQKLSAAALQTQARAVLETMDHFAKAGFDEARRKVVALQPGAIEAAHEFQDRLLYDNVGIGFCPFSCDPQRCKDGGPLARMSNFKHGPSKHVYEPVPGGPRNCIMCRHFVTAPAWIVPLELFGSKLCEKRKHLAERESEVDGRIQTMVSERMAKTSEQRKTGDANYRRAYDELNKSLQEIRDEQELVEKSIFNVEVLLRSCSKLLMEEADSEGRLPMVANGSESIVQYVETSEFEHSLLQSMASRIYPVLESHRVEAKRDRYLEMILFDGGIKPPGLMFYATPEMRRKAMDRFGDLLINRVSRLELQALAEGNQSLRDLGIWDQVNNLIESALANEIALPPRKRDDLPVLEVLK
jgi:hypothetical protein